MKFLFSMFAPGGEQAPLSILIFHRVASTPDPLCPDLPTEAEFASSMGWVRDWFNVLPLHEAAKLLAEGRLPPRALAITFDDGYADNESLAMPILKRLGLTATFFVCPGFLDGGRMWNDDVIESIRALEGNELDLSGIGLGRLSLRSVAEQTLAVDRTLIALKHLEPAVRAERVAAIVAQAGGRRGPDLMMTRTQVANLQASGMTVGAHTVTHPILTRISGHDAIGEIVEGKKELERIIGRPVTTFAYPNGMPSADYARNHVEIVRTHGFECAVSTAWGVATRYSDPYQLPRFTPWSRSKLRFAMQMLGNLRRRSFAVV